MVSDRENYYLDSCVRGHHVYLRVWTPHVGEILSTRKEAGNHHNRFAVAVLKDDRIVGHIPCEVSKTAWYFLEHGGDIRCEITSRRRRSDIAGKGLEVPCTYTFEGKPKMIKELIKLFSRNTS